jgi:hypothetical protein
MSLLRLSADLSKVHGKVPGRRVVTYLIILMDRALDPVVVHTSERVEDESLFLVISLGFL